MTPLPPDPYAPTGAWRVVETAAAWCLAILWVLPLAYAVWAAFHPPEFTTRFSLAAPLTLDNFARAWVAAPFARYFLNTFVLVTMILACQLVLCTLAAYAFARYAFRGRDVAFRGARTIAARGHPVDDGEREPYVFFVSVQIRVDGVALGRRPTRARSATR